MSDTICPVCSSARWCGRPCARKPVTLQPNVTQQLVTLHQIGMGTVTLPCPECERRRQQTRARVQRYRAKA